MNQFGRPQVYDHEFAGISRRDMVQAAKKLEDDGYGSLDDDAKRGECKQLGEEGERQAKARAADRQSSKQHAQKMREAMAFFDRIGWLTPVRVQEQGGLSVE